MPADVRPNGNAYRVTMTYQPSGAPATTITAPGNVLLTVPLPAAGLLYSGDGRTWTSIGKQTVPGQPIVGGPFNALGWFVGATHPQTVPKSSGGGRTGAVTTVPSLPTRPDQLLHLPHRRNAPSAHPSWPRTRS